MAVYVIAHAGLKYMTSEVQLIMADPYWPRKILNGPVMAWLNPGVMAKPRSQLINKLMVGCTGMTCA